MNTDTGYLDRLYRDDDDPWQLADGFYEKRKRDLLLASLDRTRFRSGFEPGCSIGLLSLQLAQRCDALLASDYHPRAVERARGRLAGLAGVRVQTMLLPDQWPVAHEFDLIVLSELGYFIDRPAWIRFCQQAKASLSPDGTVVACHWRHPFAERRTSTEELHSLLGEALPGRHAVSLVDEDFLLDLWTGSEASPAQRDGRR
ncbi:MAG: class I SAM-dependent methyltransferase [Jatrophihabitantaceae bacterium]